MVNNSPFDSPFAAFVGSALSTCFVPVNPADHSYNAKYFVKTCASLDNQPENYVRNWESYVSDPEQFIINWNLGLAVGDQGDFISIRPHAIKKNKPHLLATSDNGEGYKYVDHIRAARLVFETFNGPLPDGYEVDHMNSIRDDDRRANLRAATHSENLKNASHPKKSPPNTKDKALLISHNPEKAPVYVRACQIGKVTGSTNAYKLAHGERVSAKGWYCIVNPTPGAVKAFLEIYDLERPGLLDACLALLEADVHD